MDPLAYLETTIISYLTAKPSRDVVVAGHQESTREWWETRRSHFHLVASELVLQEAQEGDAAASRARLEILDSITLIEITDASLALAKRLIEKGAIPARAAEDALHVAVAATNGVAYLLTWNLKHIANAAMRNRIELVCREEGLEPPTICTPEELLED